MVKGVLDHPKFKTYLIRFPEKYNSKFLQNGLLFDEFKLKIIQKWDGKRLSIKFLL